MMTPKVSGILQKAEDLAKQKLWSEAADTCLSAREIETENVILLEKIGWYLSRAKRYSEAIGVFVELSRIEPQKAKWSYMIGYQFYDQQKWDEAISWFNKSLDLYSDYVVVLYRKGYALKLIQKENDAIECFSRVISIWNESDSVKKDQIAKYYSDAAYQLGKIYLQHGLSRKAEYPLSEAVKHDRGDAHKLYSYGKALLSNNKPSEAVCQLQNANKIKPREDYIQTCLAKAYAECGEIEKGLKLLERIPPKHRKHYVWKSLGEILLDDGKFEAAIDPLQKAVEGQPDNHNYLYLLAKAFEGAGKPEKSFPLLERAILLREQNYGKDFPEAQTRLMAIKEMHPGIEHLAEARKEGDGSIKTYKADKGFGFIESHRHQEDIFFHVSDVLNPELIYQGQEVLFDIQESSRGLRATKITVL
jgi:tetratricopeptide (TPR) repeat protein